MLLLLLLLLLLPTINLFTKLTPTPQKNQRLLIHRSLVVISNRFNRSFVLFNYTFNYYPTASLKEMRSAEFSLHSHMFVVVLLELGQITRPQPCWTKMLLDILSEPSKT